MIIKKLESHTWLAVLTIGAASLLLNIFVGTLFGIPLPSYHDEFAYLLAGDTFAHGRLTNPTHPFWRHFETFHVFHIPSYQAKYPPGQGAFLALGQRTTGLPIVGVWLSLALACAMTYWMLRALFSPRWAFLGSLFVIYNPLLAYWWGQMYSGGAVAMLGGALFFGGLFRLHRDLTLFSTLVMGLGIAIMANSRPFEGFIVCLFALPFVLFGMINYVKKKQTKKLFTAFILPLSSIFLILAAWILLYNQSLTGDEFKLPYTQWQPETSSFELIRSYHGSEPLSIKLKLLRFWEFFFGPALSISFFGLFSVDRKKEVFFSLGACAVLITASMLSSRAWPHYIAPITPLFYALVLSGMGGLANLKISGRQWGYFLVSAIVVFYFLIGGFFLAERIYSGPEKTSRLFLIMDYEPLKTPMHDRKTIKEALIKCPQKDLVMVRYGPDHYFYWEWVYNNADIDNSEIVWAREISPQKNKALFKYYKDRKVWLLFADESPPRLVPYNAGETNGFIETCQ
jgi:hypothetical protein